MLTYMYLIAPPSSALQSLVRHAPTLESFDCHMIPSSLSSSQCDARHDRLPALADVKLSVF